MNLKSNLPKWAHSKRWTLLPVYTVHIQINILSNLWYKFCRLFPIQIYLHRHNQTYAFSSYIFDCIRHYLLYHKDVLKLENNTSGMKSSLLYYIFGVLFNYTYVVTGIYCSHLFCKSFCLFLTKILLRKSIHTTPFSCYKFECILLSLLYHKDVLKWYNNMNKYFWQN